MNPPSLAQSRNRVPYVVFILLLLASLLPQCFWLSRPLDSMIAQSLYEDSFYYYQVARNLAQGHGALAAGGIPSNGYHPLWMLVSAGFFRVFSDDLTAIRGICALGLALSIAASFFVFLTLRALHCGVWVSVFSALFFHYNPWMMSLATSGIEAPLNALLLIMGTWHLVHQNNRLSWFAMLGLLAGLAYLTRTDNIFFDAALFAVAAWNVRSEKTTLWRGMALAAVIAFLIVLPWHLWNFFRFGQFMQGSASALPIVREIVFFDEHPGAGRSDFLLFRLGLLGGWFRSILWYTGLGSLWGLLILALAVANTLKARSDNVFNRVSALLPLFVSVLLLGVAHKFFRLATREWYYVASDVCLVLVWGMASHHILETVRAVFPNRRIPLTLAVLLTLVLPIPMLAKKTVSDWHDRLARPRAYPLEIMDAFAEIPDLQPGEPLGSTDSGILGFLSSRPFINLDGVLNPEAGRAIREGTLLNYMQSKGIRYAIITPRMMNERILGKDYKLRLRQRPELTPQGYEIMTTPTTELPLRGGAAPTPPQGTPSLDPVNFKNKDRPLESVRLEAAQTPMGVLVL